MTACSSSLMPGPPAATRPRAIFVGRSDADPAPQPFLRRKYQLLAQYLDAVLIQIGRPPRVEVDGVTIVAIPPFPWRIASSVAYYVFAPLMALRLARRRLPSAVVCQSPLEAIGVLLLSRLGFTRQRPPVVVEVHGDWRTATRLYGSHHRRVLSPVVDRMAAWALRHADRVRAVGEHTADLVRATGFAGDLVVYPAWTDYDAVMTRDVQPLPERPVVTFVGALEPTKGLDVLLDAWRKVLSVVPAARLVVAGDGSLRSWLIQALSCPSFVGSVDVQGRVFRAEVTELLDASTVLVLPSRSEGLPLVVLEAMARARPVVASRVGGIPELVIDGRTGLLSAPGDADGLALALVRILQDSEMAHTLGAHGRRAFLRRDPALAHARGVAELGQWIARGARVS